MADDFLKSLDKIPSKNAAYLWADYVELRCLVHPDRYFSLDGAEEALQEAEDYSSDAEEPNLTSSNLGLDKLASSLGRVRTLSKKQGIMFRRCVPVQSVKRISWN